MPVNQWPLHHHTFFTHHMLWSWWSHQIETLSTLLAICAGNSPVTGEFPAQSPVMRSFDVFFDLRLSKQWCGWWFEILSHPLWRHCNYNSTGVTYHIEEITLFDMYYNTITFPWNLNHKCTLLCEIGSCLAFGFKINTAHCWCTRGCIWQGF